MNNDVVDVALIHHSQEKESYLIRFLVWSQMADELLEVNPDARYVDVRDKVGKELDTIFRQYYGRLDKYLEKRGEDFMNGLPPLS
ncbi:hypothetical protein D3C87_1234120 [compost metagenome]|uniref:hypothetical protein n=1 Tax=unclassified Pseudomonas TaxID=196821 RepID=UPI000BB3537F|nr:MULTISPECIES: hypothetical protein [unclassified Pseudomonas]PBJ05829.1 hypothetical protein BSF40_30090 [Pseudomonas sp. ACN5]PMZ77341.1 hypothetical protein C1X65_06685 [Pseudomonas sp. FW305-70]